MSDFNLVIIGAGPGGYVAAVRASQLGLKVALVEKQWLGGVCLNIGCVPSKALLKNAELVYTLRERAQEFGLGFDNLKPDYAAAVKRSRQVSDRLTRGIGFLMKKNNVQVIMGTACITTKGSISITDDKGEVRTITTDHIVIATGSHPLIPEGISVDGEKIITYQKAILQEKLFQSVVILGTSAIALEFATIWNSYGSQVSVVEESSRITSTADDEVSTELTKTLTKRGIQFHFGSKVLSVKISPTGAAVCINAASGEQTLESEQVLVAVGFKPNSESLGLKEVGVALTVQGFVQVDERMATNIPGIWAIGDVTGLLMLAHAASSQGILCAEAITGKATRPINYAMVPRVIYTEPQVAWFGLSEAQAKAQNLPFAVGKFPFMANGRALGLGDYTGFAKILTDSKTGEILGAHLIGPEVSELLPELTLAWQNELTITEVGNNYHAHPTLAEAVMEAAENAEKRSIHI